MGQGKIPIRRIENTSTRQVTFAKRRVGLLKKTHELSVLCDAEIGLVIFSSSGKMFQYCSQSSSMDQIINKYHLARGIHPENTNDPVFSHCEQMQGEMRRMRKETHNLQLSLQRYTGDIDLTAVHYEDLVELEGQLENSANKVRARKFQLLQQQLDNLQRKERMLEEENQQIYQMIKETQMAWEQQQVAIAGHPKQEAEHRQLLDLFDPFSGEEQPSSFLQLALLSPHFQPPYRLQPTHPNYLQDFTLHDNATYE